MMTAEQWTPRLAQHSDELAKFIALLVHERVSSYLEIGLKFGVTFDRVGDALPNNSRMVGIDLPGGEWGTRKGVPYIEATVQRLKDTKSHRVSIIWGNSQERGSIDAARRAAPYDIVFIDGDHRLAGVQRDWNNYGPMARMVAFHDIDVANGGRAPKHASTFGVHRLWGRLKHSFRHIEIIGEKRGMGIGVLWH